MQRLHGPGDDLFDTILPEAFKKLPAELEQVDKLLDDPEVTAPFIKDFQTFNGRPGVPVATYLRLMYLKFRYKLGYETLVQEVSDSIAWRQFCGIGFTQKVPDSTALIKLTHKYGDRTVDALHQSIIRGRKLRVDTTVIAADIHYPTDASVLRDGLKKLRDTVKRIPKSGMRIGRSLKKVKELNFSITNLLRNKAKRTGEKIKTLNRRIITLVRTVLQKASKFSALKNVRETAALVGKVADQSEERMSGEKPEDRIVSIADPGARPIVKGKLDKPVEFGRVALLAQDASGYVTQYEVHQGNPSDAGMVDTLLDRHQEQFPGALRQIATDTGFSSELNVEKLACSGVTKVGIPCKGRPSREQLEKQRRPWFKALRRFRAGIEACIRFLDRKFGMKRSMFRGNMGTAIWVGWSVIAANLYRYAKLG